MSAAREAYNLQPLPHNLTRGAGRAHGVTYHVLRCREEGVTRPEFLEAFTVALVVGGSITIPHLRRAVATLDEVEGLP
jgi:alkylhydroperoxidase/carboxymuconolactone decarboxylase family protein YurZ